eukprot:9476484-Pyramimonas_sp.AAC.1
MEARATRRWATRATAEAVARLRRNEERRKAKRAALQRATAYAARILLEKGLVEFRRLHYDMLAKAEKAAVLYGSMRVRRDVRAMQRASQGWAEHTARVRSRPSTD